jgi:hypothetical protein
MVRSWRLPLRLLREYKGAAKFRILAPLEVVVVGTRSPCNNVNSHMTSAPSSFFLIPSVNAVAGALVLASLRTNQKDTAVTGSTAGLRLK